MVNFRPIICGFLTWGWFWSSSHVAVPPAKYLHTYTLCIAFTYVHEQGFCMLHVIFQSLHVFPIMTTHWKYVPTKHILNVFIQNSMCLPLRCFLYIEKLKIRLPVLILSPQVLLLLFIVSRFPLRLGYTLFFTGMESIQTWILTIHMYMIKHETVPQKDIWAFTFQSVQQQWWCKNEHHSPAQCLLRDHSLQVFQCIKKKYSYKWLPMFIAMIFNIYIL